MGKLSDTAAKKKREQQRALCPLCRLEDSLTKKAERVDLVEFFGEVREKVWSGPVAVATLRDSYPDECSKVGEQTIKTHIDTHDVAWDLVA